MLDENVIRQNIGMARYSVVTRLGLTALLLCLSVFISGCAPIPHFANRAPRITGVVSKNGAPLAGARVLLSISYGDAACRNVERETATDRAGGFKLDKVREFHLYTTMGDSLNNYHVCIVDDARLYSGLTEGSIAVPESISITCWIDSSSVTAEDAFLLKTRRSEVCMCFEQSDYPE